MTYWTYRRPYWGEAVCSIYFMRNDKLFLVTASGRVAASSYSNMEAATTGEGGHAMAWDNLEELLEKAELSADMRRVAIRELL